MADGLGLPAVPLLPADGVGVDRRGGLRAGSHV